MKINTFISKYFTVFSASIALVYSLGANAAVGLFNTGVDNSNNLLLKGSLDTHYTVDAGKSTFATNDAEGYLGYWLAPDLLSSWITPKLGANNTASGDFPSFGAFTYQTTFDLTGIDFSLLSIKGKVTADNGISDILINGISTGFTYGGPNSSAYSGFASFAISSGFHSGINTLTFDVVNGSGPTGLRTEFDNITFTPAVPEPEVYALLIAGLGLVSFMARRRRESQA
jgi:hypothetical protein